MTTDPFTLSRRGVLKGAAGLGALGLLGGCSVKKSGGSSSSDTIKIGYVSPQTGPLAPFGQADSFVVEALKSRFATGIKVGSKTYKIQVIVKDSQSSASRAADVANQLINDESVNLMLVSSTPDTTNSVSQQCEANNVPCISTVAPWQSWFFGRGAKPSTVYKWTYHFFWGLEDIESVYSDMWSQVSTNNSVGGLWPNDSDGDGFAATATGFPSIIKKVGGKLTDPGRYPDGTQSFTAQISKFKAAQCEILTGVPVPPDFITFYRQAAQQGYQPKLTTLAKALLFPSTVEALGTKLGNNLGSEVWWTPSHPFTSSLTGQSAKQLAAAFESSTGKQWIQPLGFVHALFEVAVAAITKAGGGDDGAKLIDAIKTLKINTVVGPVDWTSGPVPNVAKTPLVGGQWRTTSGGKHMFDLIIVSNKDHKNIPAGGTVQTT